MQERRYWSGEYHVIAGRIHLEIPQGESPELVLSSSNSVIQAGDILRRGKMLELASSILTAVSL